MEIEHEEGIGGKTIRRLYIRMFIDIILPIRPLHEFCLKNGCSINQLIDQDILNAPSDKISLWRAQQEIAEIKEKTLLKPG